MSRDLKKENEWRKNKYKRLVVDVDKNLAKRFLNELEQDDLIYSEWVKTQIKKYINKKEGIKMNRLTINEIKNLNVEELEKLMNEKQVNKMTEIGYNFRTMLDMLQDSAEMSGQADDEYHTSIDEYLDYLEEFFNKSEN